MQVLIVSAGIVLLDQITKYLIKANFSLHESVGMIGSLLRLTYVENTGIVFGISVGGALPLFTFLSMIAVGFVIYFLYRERTGPLGSRLGLALVLGGAIGNLIDRVLRGSVVDFLDFGFGSHRFYIFNIADSAVTVGVAIYLIMTMITESQARKMETEGA